MPGFYGFLYDFFHYCKDINYFSNDCNTTTFFLTLDANIAVIANNVLFMLVLLCIFGIKFAGLENSDYFCIQNNYDTAI